MKTFSTKTLSVTLVAALLVTSVAWPAEVRKAAKTRSSGEAQWIWSPAQADGKIPPAAVCWFRKSFEIKNPEEGAASLQIVEEEQQPASAGQ